jgi:ATP-dependent DNA helicase PIF1
MIMNNVIEATIIIKGKYKGQDVLIPRIPMIPTDLPFDFKRLQFPVRLAFAMTINKSQGQSLEVCGINLEFPCFPHGQLYVACSRVGKPSSLYIYGTAKQNKKRSLSESITLINCNGCFFKFGVEVDVEPSM